MLEKIFLHNFKCHVEQSFDFAPLTVLSGVNGIGKSSLIQALLALEQTCGAAVPGRNFIINGYLINLGQPKDVLSENALDDTLAVTLIHNSQEMRYHMALEESVFSLTDNTSWKSPFAARLVYLCAERIGPRALFPVPTPEQHSANRLGNMGQFAAYEMERLGMKRVSCEELILSQQDGEPLSGDLRTQTEAWLARVCRPVRVHTDFQPKMDLVNLEFSFSDDGFIRQFRASNVGFGLTYALPIFVAVLSARPGDFIIIENPEAHLHPKGQAVIGEFLSLAAAAGIQILVETHSDHLLNGIRVAVKHGKLAPEQTKVHFFTLGDEGKAMVISPRIDANGRFDVWPDDFFDEWDKQLAELL
ncbi:MAG: DUF3696 domain-containing protein [Desulfovibrionaceae bacterium]|nr:DUF3696 domain-containing protein [Desulfovibrionaceae bacterium]